MKSFETIQNMDENERKALRQALLEYCKLDTLDFKTFRRACKIITILKATA
ncbi:hypothetical protein [Campylobacter lari]|uniref:hypothetical protein n=1 Tax=Campylobacter lari TaxID=201 RepID=UPI001BDA075A|nr:hypothetical protein [Campylobacter lari]MBT0821768.1 hypothetical protein [Campylobacter lari]MBT0830172.1 hypothetical protein [Campylobacter lari]